MTRAKRLSASMTLQMQTWGKKRPWLIVAAVVARILFGGSVIAFAGVMAYRQPEQWKGLAIVAAVGSLILPFVPSIIASNARKYIGVWRAAKEPATEGEKSGSGTGSQKSDESSP